MDLGEPILGLRLINPQELAYWTDSEIKIWRLNMVIMTSYSSDDVNGAGDVIGNGDVTWYDDVHDVDM